MTTDSLCPDVQELQRLLLGQVSSEEGDRLGQHLLHCDRCAQAVHSLPAQQLPAAGVQEALGTLVEPREQRPAGAAPGPGSSSAHTEAPSAASQPPPPSEEPIDFLTPPQGPGELGWLGSY